MRNCLLAVLAVVMLTLPSTTIGQVPTQDSVTANVPNTTQNFSNIKIDARSRPRGEDPTGTAVFDVEIPPSGPVLTLGGSVSCLKVDGNRAVVGYPASYLSPEGVYPWQEVEVVDNQATGQADTFVASPTMQPPDCSATGLEGVPIASGDIAVVDAKPLPKPITLHQCRLGGWARLGFPSRAVCDRFVRWQCNRGRHVIYGFTLRAQCRAYIRYV
jgi:hypothetical protein